MGIPLRIKIKLLAYYGITLACLSIIWVAIHLFKQELFFESGAFLLVSLVVIYISTRQLLRSFTNESIHR